MIRAAAPWLAAVVVGIAAGLSLSVAAEIWLAPAIFNLLTK